MSETAVAGIWSLSWLVCSLNEGVSFQPINKAGGAPTHLPSLEPCVTLGQRMHRDVLGIE